MPLVEIRKASVADAEALAPRMRRADAVEVYRAASFGPLEALVRSVVASDGRAGALYFDGEPAALYGVVQPELLGQVGIPWLLTSDVVERHPVTFFRIARTMVDRWAKEFPTLLQFIDEEYVSARRLVRHLGFTVYPPVPHGPHGAMFCPAVRSQHV